MIGSLENILKIGILRSSRKSVSIQCCIQNQCVRHKSRKPRWVPMAKSKTYIVLEQPPQPRKEFEELGNIRETYFLYNKSLWRFQSECSREIEARELREAKQVSEEVELERMIKINDVENKKVEELRKSMRPEEWNEVEQNILEVRALKEEEELKKLDEMEKLVNAEMERLKLAIKLEDLDEVIEKALAVEYDYNFAITSQGQYVVGRYNNTEVVDGPVPTMPIVKSVEAGKQ